MTNYHEKVPEWNVFFDGGFWESCNQINQNHAGKEISVNKHFQWAGRHWIIPAIYCCNEGLVVEFCMQIDPKQIQMFMDKWNLSNENDSYQHFSKMQMMEMESENPLYFHFHPQLMLNGEEFVTSHGCSVSYNPCLPDNLINDWEARQAMEHYGLDASYGWMIWRSSFPWKTKYCSEVRKLSITMEQRQVSVPGQHFCMAVPGSTFEFIYPATGQSHTLTVQEYEHQEIPESTFNNMPKMEFPTHYIEMKYTITPTLPDSVLTIQDCAESDPPRQKSCDLQESDGMKAVCSVGIIGGADGPTAFILTYEKTQDKFRSAFSAPHFEPVEDVEWHLVFYEKQFDNLTVELI